MKSFLESSDSESSTASTDSEYLFTIQDNKLVSGVLLPLTFCGELTPAIDGETADNPVLSHSLPYCRLPQAPEASKTTSWAQGYSNKAPKSPAPSVGLSEPSTPIADKVTSASAEDEPNPLAPFPHISPLRPEFQCSPACRSHRSFSPLSDLSDEEEIDHSKLCPFCDNPLPERPSSILLEMLAEAKSKARRKPRPNNEFGMKVALAICAPACARHQWETEQVPLAEKEGWPTVVDWEEIERRIVEMRGDLESLLYDSVIDEDGEERSVRELSPFWIKAMKTMERNGTMANGVRAEFASFETVNPGYYGEVSYALIFFKLHEMFPTSVTCDMTVDPLNLSEFFKYVLIPEVAVRLIMQDQELVGPVGMRIAANIMKESWFYGVGMFPSNDVEVKGRR
ncbi:hypothetical protein VKT23_005364 [Stygiomarasmius scandens]|uniref:Restriction of telomere capping protein 4 n=1 Tax=Marasmiellus scandens TaxID=2682957 RepID=A0ABR1JQQ0_9AGAR